MIWTSLDSWIAFTGVLCALSCALLGNFLVLRRMSMMGDAISHAVLPGLAIAFLFTGSRASVAMLIGAAAAGILTALFTQWIRRFGKVDEGAAMGVVFTTLFAMGLILIVRAADAVDLDPGCVLYGAIELVPLDTISFHSIAIPRAVVMISSALLINLAFVILFFKELHITAFDPELATTQGISASFFHYATMTLVAVTCVACFESVGSILVIAMLIVPAATAYLLCTTLLMMTVVSAVIAIFSAVLGHLMAITLPGWWGFSDTTTAGCMALAAGIFFFTALLCAPRSGIISKSYFRFALSLRIAQEDILGIIYRLEELSPGKKAAFTKQLLKSATKLGFLSHVLAVTALKRRGELYQTDGFLQLSPAGRSKAKEVIRSHRLWESFLVKQLGLSADHVHAASENLEHITTKEMQEKLAERTGHPTQDPHGQKIPPD